MTKGEFKEAAVGLIKAFISLLEGYLELLRAGLFWSQPKFWSIMASEDIWVIGTMFKAFAIFTTSVQSVPKVSSPEELKKAESVIKDSIDKLRTLLDDLEGS